MRQYACVTMYICDKQQPQDLQQWCISTIKATATSGVVATVNIWACSSGININLQHQQTATLTNSNTKRACIVHQSPCPPQVKFYSPQKQVKMLIPFPRHKHSLSPHVAQYYCKCACLEYRWVCALGWAMHSPRNIGLNLLLSVFSRPWIASLYLTLASFRAFSEIQHLL